MPWRHLLILLFAVAISCAVARADKSRKLNDYMAAVQRCGDDSEAAFLRLYEEGMPILTYVLQKKLAGSPTQSRGEDAAQDAFVSYSRLPCERRPTQFGWFITTGLHAAWKYRSEESASEAVDWLAVSHETVDETDDEPTSPLEDQVSLRLGVLMGRLPSDERKALLLTRRGATYREIADTLGVTEKQAEWARRRALLNVRTWLANDPLIDLPSVEREAAVAALPPDEAFVSFAHRHGMTVRQIAAERRQTLHAVHALLDRSRELLQGLVRDSEHFPRLVERYRLASLLGQITDDAVRARAVSTLETLPEQTKNFLLLRSDGMVLTQIAETVDMNPDYVGRVLRKTLFELRQLEGVPKDLEFVPSRRNYELEAGMPIYLFDGLTPREWTYLPAILSRLDEKWLVALEMTHAGQSAATIREATGNLEVGKTVQKALRVIARELGRAEIHLAPRPGLVRRARQLARRFVGSLPETRTEELVEALTHLTETQLRTLELRVEHLDWEEASKAAGAKQATFRQRFRAVIEKLAISLRVSPARLIFRAPKSHDTRQKKFFAELDYGQHLRLRAAALELPARQMEVLLLTRDGLSLEEVAVVVGRNEGEIASDLATTREFLAHALGTTAAALTFPPVEEVERIAGSGGEAETDATTFSANWPTDQSRDEWIAQNSAALFHELSAEQLSHLPQALASLRDIELWILRLHWEGASAADIAKRMHRRYQYVWNVLDAATKKLAAELLTPTLRLAPRHCGAAIEKTTADQGT